MKRIALIPTIGMVISLIGLTAASGATLLVDFSGDTVGQPPANATTSGTTSLNTILVHSGPLNQDTAPPVGRIINNPFSGNSLQFLKEGTGSSPLAIWTNLPTGNAGTLDFTAYSYYGSSYWNTTYFGVQLMDGSNVGVAVLFSNNNLLIGTDTGSGATFLTISGYTLRDQTRDVSIDFSLETKTYSLMIDGTSVVYGASQTEFAFMNNAVTEFDTLRFGTIAGGASLIGTQTYLESFGYTVIPEPGTGMLLGLTFAVTFLRRRTTGNR